MPDVQQLAFDLFGAAGEQSPAVAAPARPKPSRVERHPNTGKTHCDHDDDGAHGRKHGHEVDDVRECTLHERLEDGVSPSGADWRACFVCAEHAAPVAAGEELLGNVNLPHRSRTDWIHPDSHDIGDRVLMVYSGLRDGPSCVVTVEAFPERITDEQGTQRVVVRVVADEGTRPEMLRHMNADYYELFPLDEPEESVLTLVPTCPRCGEEITAIPVDTTFREAEAWAYITAQGHQCSIRPHDDEAITCDSCGFPNADGSACECPDTLGPGVQVVYHLISERRPGVPWQVYTEHGVCWECIADHLHPDAWRGYSLEDIPEEVGAEVGRWTSDQPMKCGLCFCRMNPDGTTWPEPITCNTCGSRWGCPDLCTRFVERWAAVSSPTTEDAAREFATLSRLRSVEGLNVYRLIAFAESDAEALKVAKVECSNGGSYSTGFEVSGTAKGIKYEVAGFSGLVTYREVVEYVRGGARQSSMAVG